MVDVRRPVFFEGQILGAADLTDTVDYDRARAARHERVEHDWGITSGLTLQKTKQQTGGTPYVDVVVTPGTATDGTGREIVVSAPVTLSTTLFQQVNVVSQQTDAFYPVVLRGLDDALSADGAVTVCGPGAGARRVTEAFDVTFRGVGDAAGLDDQPVPAVDDGPGPLDGQPWDVLLGFVSWDDGIQQFTDAVDRSGGVGRRYAGVKADSIAARGGSLELRPGLNRQAGGIALVLGGDPAVLTFGVYKGDGSVDDRMTVSAQGDLHVAGKITGRLTAGETRVQSGVATDGITLPLPPGISQDDIDRGAVVLHILVSPVVSGRPAPAGTPIGPFPQECFVDEHRVLHCLVRWTDSNATANNSIPVEADYLIVAIGAQPGS